MSKHTLFFSDVNQVLVNLTNEILNLKRELYSISKNKFLKYVNIESITL